MHDQRFLTELVTLLGQASSVREARATLDLAGGEVSVCRRDGAVELDRHVNVFAQDGARS